jgi:hypothetical protein
VSVMTKLLPAPKLVGAVRDGDDGHFAYRLDPGDGRPPLVMAWHAGRPVEMSLPTKSTKATLIDLLGHRASIEAKDGTLTFPAGPLPVYVIEE